MGKGKDKQRKVQKQNQKKQDAWLEAQQNKKEERAIKKEKRKNRQKEYDLDLVSYKKDLIKFRL